MDARAAAEVTVHGSDLSGRDPGRDRGHASGRRRTELEAMAQAIFDEDFDRRILPFDARAAGAYAELFTVRRRGGRPIETPDLIVAATARAYDAAIVTRDTGGLEGCGLTLVNPWDSKQ